MESPEPGAIRGAVEILRGGGIVAFPTETVYGLGADAFNPGAVARVFMAKGRPPDNPLIVHIAHAEQLRDLAAVVPPDAERLAERFWPGPLTMVLKRKSSVPDIVTAGLDTVAARIPRHNVPLALIRELSRGIVGPSANASGRPSPTTAEHVYSDLNGRIDMILDAGPTPLGLESTVIDLTTRVPTLLRFGGLSREQIEGVIGPVRTTEEEDGLKRSPGTRHRHYAPRAKVVLIEQGDDSQIRMLYGEYSRKGNIVGCIVHGIRPLEDLAPERWIALPPQAEAVARSLFASLRELDSLGVDVILIEKVPETGIGAAIMDRLRRAAE